MLLVESHVASCICFEIQLICVKYPINILDFSQVKQSLRPEFLLVENSEAPSVGSALQLLQRFCSSSFRKLCFFLQLLQTFIYIYIYIYAYICVYAYHSGVAAWSSSYYMHMQGVILCKWGFKRLYGPWFNYRVLKTCLLKF